MERDRLRVSASSPASSNRGLRKSDHFWLWCGVVFVFASVLDVLIYKAVSNHLTAEATRVDAETMASKSWHPRRISASTQPAATTVSSADLIKTVTMPIQASIMVARVGLPAMAENLCNVTGRVQKLCEEAGGKLDTQEVERFWLTPCGLNASNLEEWQNRTTTATVVLESTPQSVRDVVRVEETPNLGIYPCFRPSKCGDEELQSLMQALDHAAQRILPLDSRDVAIALVTRHWLNLALHLTESLKPWKVPLIFFSDEYKTCQALHRKGAECFCVAFRDVVTSSMRRSMVINPQLQLLKIAAFKYLLELRYNVQYIEVDVSFLGDILQHSANVCGEDCHMISLGRTDAKKLSEKEEPPWNIMYGQFYIRSNNVTRDFARRFQEAQLQDMTEMDQWIYQKQFYELFRQHPAKVKMYNETTHMLFREVEPEWQKEKGPFLPPQYWTTRANQGLMSVHFERSGRLYGKQFRMKELGLYADVDGYYSNADQQRYLMLDPDFQTSASLPILRKRKDQAEGAEAEALYRAAAIALVTGRELILPKMHGRTAWHVMVNDPLHKFINEEKWLVVECFIPSLARFGVKSRENSFLRNDKLPAELRTQSPFLVGANYARKDLTFSLPSGWIAPHLEDWAKWEQEHFHHISVITLSNVLWEGFANPLSPVASKYRQFRKECQDFFAPFSGS